MLKGGVASVTMLMVSILSEVQAGWCGDCWCSLGEAGGECPTRPQNYTLEFQQAIYKQTPENPYDLTCNPYKDAGCDTVPAIDDTLGDD